MDGALVEQHDEVAAELRAGDAEKFVEHVVAKAALRCGDFDDLDPANGVDLVGGVHGVALDELVEEGP